MELEMITKKSNFHTPMCFYITYKLAENAVLYISNKKSGS